MQTLGNIKNDPGMKFRPRFQRSKFPLGTKIIHTLGVAGMYVCMYVCMYVHLILYVYVYIYIYVTNV